LTTISLRDLTPTYGFCDPASGEQTLRKVASRSAIVVAAPDHLGRIFALYAWAARVSAGELMEKIYQVNDQFQPRSFGIEANGLQTLYKGAILRDAALRERQLPLVGIHQPTRTQKDNRIRGYLQPLVGNGKLFLREDMVELQHEIVTFPMNPTKDLIDALASVCGMIPAARPQRRFDAEREAELEYLRRSGAPIAEIEARASRRV
jgi:hypothetical protein